MELDYLKKCISVGFVLAYFHYFGVMSGSFYVLLLASASGQGQLVDNRQEMEKDNRKRKGCRWMADGVVVVG